ncbi:helix-turn-helix transcriptional regulator [bacterium]|nr:helix-turn-helix transcriptional regulator [bacterium]
MTRGEERNDGARSAGATGGASIVAHLHEFIDDDSSVMTAVLLAIAFVLAGISRVGQSTTLAPLGGFPLPGDNVPMAVLCAVIFGVAWATPQSFERLAASGRGRALACGVAMTGALCLAAVGVLSRAGSTVDALAPLAHAGSVLTRAASALLLLEVASLTAHRELAWSTALVCLAFVGAIACDLCGLLLSSAGAMVLGLALPVVAWALLRRLQRERKGAILEHGRRREVFVSTQRHPFALEIALFGLYGLVAGMSSGQGFAIAAGMSPAIPRSPVLESLVNDAGLALGVILLGVGVALVAGRRVSPMPLRCLTLPASMVCLFLAPIAGGVAGTLVPLLVSATQVLMYGLLWLFPHVTDAHGPLRSYAAACCAFFACTFAGMWVGGEVLPMATSGDTFLVLAVVLVGAILVLEIAPLLFAGQTVADRAGGGDAATPDVMAAPDASQGVPQPAAPDFSAVIDEAARRWGLTPREQAVLPGLARGRSMAHIAAELVVSKNTVHTHVRNIYAKADVHSQEELIDAVERIARGMTPTP